MTLTTDQDKTLQQLVTRLQDAIASLHAAKERWQAVNNAPSGVDGHASLDAAGALDRAVSEYRQAASMLAQAVASAYSAGYRLRRGDDHE